MGKSILVLQAKSQRTDGVVDMGMIAISTFGMLFNGMDGIILSTK
jgi:hypothetical protein